MPHSPLDRFSIAVTGSGALMAPFITEGMKAFPNAEFYDRSEQTVAFTQNEIALGKSEFASPQFRAMALRAQANLRRPPRCDVTLAFRRGADFIEWVTVESGSNRRLLGFPAPGNAAFTMAQLDDAMNKLIQAIQMI